MRAWVGMATLLAMTPVQQALAQVLQVTVPLAAVTIYPGDVVKRELLQERTISVRSSLAKSYFTSHEELVGKVAVRVLPTGKAIPLNAVRDPHVFKEGQRVTLNYGDGGLAITGAGQALQPGVVGRTVNVKNLDTGIVVRGEVLADGTVSVGGANP